MMLRYTRSLATLSGIFLIVMLATAVPLGATDAEVQNTLRLAGCLMPKIKLLWDQGAINVYEANCAATSHRIVTVTCSRGQCRVDETKWGDMLDQRNTGAPYPEDQNPELRRR